MHLTDVSREQTNFTCTCDSASKHSKSLRLGILENVEISTATASYSFRARMHRCLLGVLNELSTLFEMPTLRSLYAQHLRRHQKRSQEQIMAQWVARVAQFPGMECLHTECGAGHLYMDTAKTLSQ